MDIKKELGESLGIEVVLNEQRRTVVVWIEPDGWIHYLNQWWKARRRPTVKLEDYIVAINGALTYNNQHCKFADANVIGAMFCEKVLHRTFRKYIASRASQALHDNIEAATGSTGSSVLDTGARPEYHASAIRRLRHSSDATVDIANWTDPHGPLMQNLYARLPRHNWHHGALRHLQ